MCPDFACRGAGRGRTSEAFVRAAYGRSAQHKIGTLGTKRESMYEAPVRALSARGVLNVRAWRSSSRKGFVGWTISCERLVSHIHHTPFPTSIAGSQVFTYSKRT